jgi:hypothetical protein
VPGAAPLLSQRRQAPAGHHRPVPRQRAEYDASHQFVTISGFQLSAVFTKASAGNAAAATKPHRRSRVHRSPAGSFFQGFRTPALYPHRPLVLRPASETLQESGPSPHTLEWRGCAVSGISVTAIEPAGLNLCRRSTANQFTYFALLLFREVKIRFV